MVPPVKKEKRLPAPSPWWHHPQRTPPSSPPIGTPSYCTLLLCMYRYSSLCLELFEWLSFDLWEKMLQNVRTDRPTKEDFDSARRHVTRSLDGTFAACVCEHVIWHHKQPQRGKVTKGWDCFFSICTCDFPCISCRKTVVGKHQVQAIKTMYLL